jgi:hypothetical protein
MRFTIHDANISINLPLSTLIYDSTATVSIQLTDLKSFLRGDTTKYTSVFKPLQQFDCGGRTIMEDWVRHVSTTQYNYATFAYTNKNTIMSQLQTDYLTELSQRTTLIPSMIASLRNGLYANRRCEFKEYDVLLYRTTISPYAATPSIPSKRYLMQVIIAP